MKNTYCIRIEGNNEDYFKIDEILKVVATSKSNYWECEFSDLPNVILEIYNVLNPNFSSLANIGIFKENISLWLFYEYETQCNMEFTPIELNLLNKLGITFCISCWESS